METQNTKFEKIMQKIKSPDFVYLGVIFVFFIIVIILFLYSTNFIVENMNKIFSSANDGKVEALNVKNYSLIAKRLNLPINEGTENPQPTTSQNNPTVTPTTTETPAVSAPAVIDKKSITINVLNSTKKRGIAATLAKTLEDTGFSKATTGDEKKPYDLTTILVKESKKEYKSSIEETVKGVYPKATVEINPETSSFDVVIIIGKE
jgi:hypothetical protein